MPDSSFEAQQKQLVAPWEVPWQISETPSKAAGRILRLLRLLRGAGNMPDGSFEAPIETGCGAAEVPDSSFEAPIETGCGASEVPDSSFEAQQKQFVFPKGFGSCNGKALLLKVLKL